MTKGSNHGRKLYTASVLASPIVKFSRVLPGLLVLVLLTAAPFALYALKDPERAPLDDAARASAPGRFVHLSDGYTHYDIGGPATGRPVVLVAGFSVPYYIWDPTFSALVDAGFRVLRYDYYGRGYSDRPDARYDQDLYVRQLSELLDAVGMKGAVDLVGLSMGGAVVTSMADRQPGRVRSLVYIDPSFRTPYAPPSTLGWSFLAAVHGEHQWADEQLADFLHPERFPDWPDKYRVQLQYRGFRRARLSELVTNAHVDQRDEVARVGTHVRPVLAIWGKQDRTVPFELSEQFLRVMPKARLVPVDQAGHLPHLEQPATVNRVLREFLSAEPTQP